MPQISPVNITALLAHRGRGNPPPSHPGSAISNCFPGLEFDFRAAWKRVLVGVELHEADTLVVAVEAGSAAAGRGLVPGHRLLSVDGKMVTTIIRGPRQPGQAPQELPQEVPPNLEWGNALAELNAKAGQMVDCVFTNDAGTSLTASLQVRRLFDGVALLPDAAAPGVLTQGLCSPWQNDYRECGCYYWAASRPDYVNVEVVAGRDSGHNWMHKGRTAATPRVYVDDDAGTPGQLTYEDLFRNWENELRFIIKGRDEQ